MLALSALRSAVKDEHHRGDPMVTTFDICTGADECGFPDFSDANALLESIDFDDLFVGMDDGDVLPDLEMYPQLLAGFSITAGEESSDANTSPSPDNAEEDNTITNFLKKEDEEKSFGFEAGSDESVGGEEVSGKNGNNSNNSSTKEGHGKSRKSSSQSKNSQEKRKVKVDWTAELHRRFVQAVEQLGVDKAVPSRILEIMGIDCLTRHNIASHLQKYRSHRKHLVAREAEAASWTQRRQMYGGGGKTMGFPPPPMHQFRPLHVWGHPSMWPKHHQPPPSWGPPTPGTPCFPPPMRFGAPHGIHAPPRPLFDFLPSKESIDAAIGDVLSKPWLPLPLGLTPPSTDSVMVELHRQGVPRVQQSLIRRHNLHGIRSSCI